MLKNFKMVKVTYSCCYFFCIKKAETRKQCDKMIKTKIAQFIRKSIPILGRKSPKFDFDQFLFWNPIFQEIEKNVGNHKFN